MAALAYISSCLPLFFLSLLLNLDRELLESMNVTFNNDLIRGIVENDLTILKKIYRESLPEVIKYVERNSGTKDDGKDVFQEGILVIFRKASAGDLELTTSFHNFLFAICKRIWLKKLRKKSGKEVPFDEILEYSDEEDLDEALLKSQKWELFNKRFMDLPDECRQVLKMLFNKASGKEIAAKMGYTEDYAKRKKYKCKQSLADLIKSDPNYKQLTEN